MKKLVAVLTGDPYLRQKIRLILGDGFEVTDNIKNGTGKLPEIAFYDVERHGGSVDSHLRGIRLVKMSRYTDSELNIPFSPAQILAFFEQKSDTPPLILEKKTAKLHGKEIKLTELEAALLSRLYEAHGEYVSREELLRGVWGEEADGGILNVYVHYLREKLEAGGEKIILSSRMKGYKIDERYIKKHDTSC